MTYSAPVLLIFGPILAAIITSLFARWQRTVAVAGLVSTVVLLWAVTAVAPETPGFVGNEWVVGGRVLLFSPELKPIFQYLLLGLSVLFLLAIWYPQGQTFVPATLATLSPLAAALMISQFTFGAVFLVIAVAFAMGTYQPQRLRQTYGGMRYLLLSALIVPLLLFAGWLLDSGQAAQQSTLIAQVLFAACLILLAGFPLYIWVQPIVAEAPLLVLAFLFGLVQLAVSTFIINVLHGNAGLIVSTSFNQWVLFSGLATLLLAALLALTARSWRDLLAYLLLFNMGLAFLTLAMPTLEIARATAVALHGARFVSLLLLFGGLILCQRHGLPDEIEAWAGYGRTHFWPLSLLVYGGLSLLGLPLTISFTSIWTITLGLGAQFSTWHTILFWSAFACIVFALIRALITLFQQTPDIPIEQTHSG